MGNTESYAHAVSRLREVLIGLPKDPELTSLVNARDEVIARYQPRFAASAVDTLTADDIKEFLLFKNNRHWTGLHRMGTTITAVIDI